MDLQEGKEKDAKTSEKNPFKSSFFAQEAVNNSCKPLTAVLSLFLSLQQHPPIRPSSAEREGSIPFPNALRNVQLLPESSEWAANPVISSVLPGFVPKMHTPTDSLSNHPQAAGQEAFQGLRATHGSAAAFWLHYFTCHVLQQ